MKIVGTFVLELLAIRLAGSGLLSCFSIKYCTKRYKGNTTKVRIIIAIGSRLYTKPKTAAQIKKDKEKQAIAQFMDMRNKFFARIRVETTKLKAKINKTIVKGSHVNPFSLK